jgi:uncharacterized protein YyaL (SSP411 family)
MEMALQPMRQVAVSGGASDAATHTLVSRVWRRFDPLRVLAWGDPDSVPLLQDRPMRDGRPTAYVCEHFACRSPVTDPQALDALLTTRTLTT